MPVQFGTKTKHNYEYKINKKVVIQEYHASTQADALGLSSIKNRRK